jgi:hypothetical protein
VVANANYIIGVRSNADPKSYTQDLIDAMDRLAPEVAVGLDDAGDSNRLRTRNRFLHTTTTTTTTKKTNANNAEDYHSSKQEHQRHRILTATVSLPTTIDGTILASKLRYRRRGRL